MTAKPQISITGATGHLGSALIPLMLDQGYRLNCLYRKHKLSIEHPNLKWVKGDLENTGSLSKLLKGSNALIHAASLISVGEDNHPEVFQVNVKGIEKVITKCLEHHIKLVYISSSTAVEAGNPMSVLDEAAPWKKNKEFYYGWTKAEAEKKIQDSVQNEGLNSCILRPTALIGPPDFGPSRFGRTILDIHQGKLPMITTGGYNLIDVRDFSQTVINSIERGRKGEAYFTGGRYYSLKDLAARINPEKVPFCISVDLLIRILPLVNLYSRVFPMRWPINKESLITLKNAPRNLDSSKAEKHLLHKTRPLNDSVKDLINWMSKNNKQ